MTRQIITCHNLFKFRSFQLTYILPFRRRSAGLGAETGRDRGLRGAAGGCGAGSAPAPGARRSRGPGAAPEPPAEPGAAPPGPLPPPLCAEPATPDGRRCGAEPGSSGSGCGSGLPGPRRLVLGSPPPPGPSTPCPGSRRPAPGKARGAAPALAFFFFFLTPPIFFFFSWSGRVSAGSEVAHAELLRRGSAGPGWGRRGKPPPCKAPVPTWGKITNILKRPFRSP